MLSRTAELRVEDLSWVRKRLQHSSDAGDLCRVQSQLNVAERLIPIADPEVQVHFYLLRGAVLIKSVSLGQHAWLRSPLPDILQGALTYLADADKACSRLAERTGWSNTLSMLQQACAYESCVAASLLRQHGVEPNLVFDTSRLDSYQHRKVISSLRNGHSLRSSF